MIVTAKHNEQSFDLELAPHIHPEESHLNEYYTFYGGIYRDETRDVFETSVSLKAIALGVDPDPLDECEKALEARNFEANRRRYFNTEYGEALALQNKKYEKSGHKKRDAKTMDDWIKSPQYAPTEEIIGIGNVLLKDEIDKSKAKAAMREYVDKINKWSKEHGNHVVILDYAFHLNEDGAPHAHITTTYEYTDDDGIKHAGKGKALKATGIEPPRTLTLEETLKTANLDIALRDGEITDVTKAMTLRELLKRAKIDITDKDAVEKAAYVKIGKIKGYTLDDTLNRTIEDILKEERYNNRQITFTAICREMWQDACDNHGFDVDRETEPSREHQDKQAYIATQNAKQRETDAEREIRRYGLAHKQTLESKQDYIAKQQKLEERESELDREVLSKANEIVADIIANAKDIHHKRALELAAEQAREKARADLFKSATLNYDFNSQSAKTKDKEFGD
jgi:kynurenine formamidase